MPGYFKIKRPFATKTNNLQEKVVKDLAEALKETEDGLERTLDDVRNYKVIVKKIEPMYARIEKDSKNIEKIKALLPKKFDEGFENFTTKLFALNADIRRRREALIESLEQKNKSDNDDK